MSATLPGSPTAHQTPGQSSSSRTLPNAPAAGQCQTSAPCGAQGCLCDPLSSAAAGNRQAAPAAADTSRFHAHAHQRFHCLPPPPFTNRPTANLTNYSQHSSSTVVFFSSLVHSSIAFPVLTFSSLLTDMIVPASAGGALAKRVVESAPREWELPPATAILFAATIALFLPFFTIVSVAAGGPLSCREDPSRLTKRINRADLICPDALPGPCRRRGPAPGLRGCRRERRRRREEAQG